MLRPARLAWIACALSIVTAVVWAQADNSGPEQPARIVREAPAEFQFVRLAYSSNSYGRGGWGRRQMWQTDWPDAEHHFSRGVSRLTRVAVAEQGRILSPLDEEIFDYPWIYAVEVGYWNLNDQEANQLWLNGGNGTFMEGALMSGSAFNVDGNPEASMGVTAGDFDADGDEDLFMTHLSSQTNTLYRNDGKGNFTDATASAVRVMPMPRRTPAEPPRSYRPASVWSSWTVPAPSP